MNLLDDDKSFYVPFPDKKCDVPDLPEEDDDDDLADPDAIMIKKGGNLKTRQREGEFLQDIMNSSDYADALDALDDEDEEDEEDDDDWEDEENEPTVKLH